MGSLAGGYNIRAQCRIPFKDFVMLAKVMIIFSQIWLQTRYESRKNSECSLYSWLPTGTYYRNLEIWKKNSSNILYRLKSYFPGQNLAKIFK